MLSQLFKEHIKILLDRVFDNGHNKTTYDTIVIHSGVAQFYYNSDQEILFRTFPHFRYFCPLDGPNHFLILKPRERPRLIIVNLEDFWHDQERETNPFWTDSFRITEVVTTESAWQILKNVKGHIAFIGDEMSCKQWHASGFSKTACDPKKIIDALNEMRTRKTPYEITCIEDANKITSAGFKRAYEKFMDGGSELDIHHAYLVGSKQTEEDLPYPIITALDSKTAILHYQKKRVDYDNGKVCLVDAGASSHGYASDITRTWVTPRANKIFKSILSALNILQQKLCAQVRPGILTIELHHASHLGIADILYDHKILTITGDAAINAGLTFPFFPHGLGHFLGIQTHDVGVPNIKMDKHPLHSLYQNTRATRKLEVGNVITIEPGIYFIPMLLKKIYKTKNRKYINWDIANALTPYGGMRIEDDILVTQNRQKNLTSIAQTEF